MTTYNSLEWVGVYDGTVPPSKADGKAVNAKKRASRATKDNTNALVAGDKIYLGRIPTGAIYKTMSGVTDTSWGTTTISIGTLASPAKYVNAKTLTTVDAPTVLGPNAASAVQAALTDYEDLYATLGVGGLAAAVKTAFNIEYTISA